MKSLKVFLIIIFSFFLITSHAINSAQSGNWSDPNTWVGGVVPSLSDNVAISANNTVSIDVTTAVCNNLTFASTNTTDNNTSTSKLDFNVNGGILTIYGNVTFGGGTHNISSWTGVGAKLVFNGTAAQTFTTGTNTRFGTLEINKSSGTVTQATGGTIRIENSLTIAGGGTFTMGSGNNINGFDFATAAIATTPTISIGINSTMNINGASTVRSGSTGVAIGNVTILGTLNLNTTSGGASTGIYFGAVTVGDGTNAATLFINGDFLNGKFSFSSITVNNNAIYNLSATTTGGAPVNSIHGTATYLGGSTVIYGSGAAAGLPFSDVNYGNLTMGRTTTWTLAADRTISNNLVVNETGIFTITSGGANASLTKLNVSGNVTVDNTSTLKFNTASLNLSGNLIVQGTGTFNGGGTALSAANSAVHSITGTVTINGGVFQGTNTASGANTCSPTYNILGDVDVASGSFIGTVSCEGSVPAFNLEGSLTTSGGTIKASTVAAPNTTSLVTINFSNTSGLNNNSNLSVTTGLTNIESLWRFTVAGGRTVNLLSDIELGSNTPVTTYTEFAINGNATLYCGTSLIKSATSATDTRFTMATDATLGMGHSGGITTAGTADGNIQTITRTYLSTSNYTYNGSTNQATGTGLPASIKNLLIANTGAAANNNVTLTNPALSIGANTCTITSGIFEVGTNTFDGVGGNLTMTGGMLRIAKLSSLTTILLPEMDGTYSLTGGTIELYGAGSQILRGARTYYNLIYSGSNTFGTNYKNLSSAIIINNNLEISGAAVLDAIDVSGNAVSMSGNAGLTMSGTARYRMKLLNNSLPELTGAYSLTAGTIELYGSGAGQTHSLNGTAGGVDPTYYNVELNADALNNTFGQANIVLGSSIKIANSIIINSPASFQISDNFRVYSPAPGLIGPSGSSFELKSGATLQYGSADGINTTTTSGNIRVAGTRTLSSSANYGFIGGVEMVSGNELPSTINNLFIYKTGSKNCTLTQSVTVDGTLTLNTGIISTNAFRVIMANTTAANLIHSTAGASFVNGNLRRTIATNTSNYEFPVGDGTLVSSYKRLDLVNNNLNGISYIDGYVNSITEIAPNDDATFITALQIQSTTPLVSINEAAEWDLTPNTTTFTGDYGVRLYVANTGLSSADDDEFCPVKRPSASVTYADWVSLETSTTIPALGSPGRLYNGGAGYAERLGYAAFSKHAIAKGTRILPIELLSFTAKYNGATVDLNWITASELNNDYFTIERSADAVNFVEINNTDGAGNSNQTLFYSTIDTNPLNGISYYRLKQTDFNGQFSYSNIVSINIDKKDAFQVLNTFNSTENGALDVTVICGNSCLLNFELFDMTGKKVFSSTQNNTGNNKTISIPTTMLSRGIYLLKVYNGKDVISKKVKLV